MIEQIVSWCGVFVVIMFTVFVFGLLCKFFYVMFLEKDDHGDDRFFND